MFKIPCFFSGHKIQQEREPFTNQYTCSKCGLMAGFIWWQKRGYKTVNHPSEISDEITPR